MELRSHARILKQSRWFILLLTVVAGVAALLFSLLQPVSYQAQASFDVNFINRAEVADYQYGAYYDLKGAELYTQHVMSWMMNPAVVAQVYQAADQGYEIESIGRFTGRFRTNQYSAQHFVVEFKDYDRGAAEKLAAAVGAVIENRAANASQLNNQAVFQVKALTPVVAPSELNVWFVTIVGVFAGALLSLVLVYLREYFR